MNNNTNFINELSTQSKPNNQHDLLTTSQKTYYGSEGIKKLQLTNENLTLSTERHVIIDHKSSNENAEKIYDKALKRDQFQPLNINIHHRRNKSMDWVNEQNDEDMSPSSFDLQKIVETYGEDSEIFQLILVSKVEEDRRRIEEAKLKQKKIDFLVSNKGNFINIFIRLYS